MAHSTILERFRTCNAEVRNETLLAQLHVDEPTRFATGSKDSLVGQPRN